jgi:hypothetical protein
MLVLLDIRTTITTLLNSLYHSNKNKLNKRKLILYYFGVEKYFVPDTTVITALLNTAAFIEGKKSLSYHAKFGLNIINTEIFHFVNKFMRDF